MKLCSPKCTSKFYPLAVESDSANHSGVNFANPNFLEHPDYRWDTPVVYFALSQDYFTITTLQSFLCIHRDALEQQSTVSLEVCRSMG